MRFAVLSYGSQREPKTAYDFFYTACALQVDTFLYFLYNMNSNKTSYYNILSILKEAVCLNNPAERRISSRCEDFVCRVCRTKTGWPHQKWCSSENTEPGCSDCLYAAKNGTVCKHPQRRKAVQKNE